MKLNFFRFFLAACALAGAALPSHAAVLVNTNDTWRYFKGTAEASTPDTTAWRLTGFNDGVAGWLDGQAPFFYENGSGYSGKTDLTPDMGTGAYTCIFMRKTFTVANPADVARLIIDLQSDDGCIVWINGQEVGSLGRPSDPITYQSLAPDASGEPKTGQVTLDTPGALLVAGQNVMAVQAFNQSATSSDFLIEASLSSQEFDNVPPVVTSVDPAPGSLQELSQITVTFSEPVDGVDGSDLLINGIPGTSVIGDGAIYTFYFPQPPFGPVQITWAVGNDIKDLGVPGNPINPATPGNTWQYTLEDIFPPEVASISPQAGTIVRSLTSIEIAFNEDVTGVNAADLTIGGSAATSMDALSASHYVFNFPQPPTGAVQVAWIAGHGIKDVAAVPNDFAGGSWQYTLDPNAEAASLFITEFMAVNAGPLADEDGEFSDWIEIYNGGQIVADLGGYYLTDNAGNLTKWEFPATNLLAGAYMIVFASEKNRRVPGAPLHTNFKLASEGEFLALVKPDGLTIVSSYTPKYPVQTADVSYGLSTASQPITLVADNASARVLVPSSGSLGLDWTAVDFNDASWTAAVNGIGFEGSPGTVPNLSGSINTDIGAAMRMVNSSAYIRFPFVVEDASAFNYLTLKVKYDDGFIAYLNGAEIARRNLDPVLAHSVTEFSGVQGQNNWSYGYYNKTLDPDVTYQDSDFIQFPGGEGQGAWNGTTQLWTGSAWDMNTASAAPWTFVGASDGHPNGSNSGNEHWAMRRWVSEVNADLLVKFRISKSNVNGGNGVTGRIFHNGVEKFTKTIAFNNNANVTNDVFITGVLIGDRIDIALDAMGTDNGTADGSDGSIFTADIELANGASPDWNLAASFEHPDDRATVYEEIDITKQLVGLQTGMNVLAIQGLNVGVSDDDFLIAATMEGSEPGVVSSEARYFTTPTPGEQNGVGTGNLGPIIYELTHSPAEPLPGEPLTISVRVAETFNPVNTVTLRYRVNYNGEISLPMASAGGDVYTATIPADAAPPGQMIRWYVSASDSQARLSRYPAFEDPLNSPEYDGTIAYLEATNNLPVLHWFAQNPSAANNDAGTRCSLYFEGEFYDNVNMNLHGQSSRGFPKRSYDIDFHRGYNFRWDKKEIRVDDINLLTTYPDKAHMRNSLAYGTYRDSGSAYHFVKPVRVQQNGAFLGDWHMVENGDDNWLERLGLDPEGALYKMYNTFTALSHANIGSGAAEKKTRKQEGNADLVDLFNGITSANLQIQTNYLYDHIDIPATVNYLAARGATGDTDCCHKNYYFYRDSDGSGEWQGMPWDVDLSFGRVWNGTDTYWDNRMQVNTALQIGNNNGFFSKIYSYAPTRQMYYRRIRTLMDTLLQTTNTLPHELKYEKQIDELAAMLGPDAALDLTRNGTWIQSSAGPNYDSNHPDYETMDEAVARLKQYLRDRRVALYNRIPGNTAEIPDEQPDNTVLNFGSIDYSPASGNQAQEYIQIINNNAYAVDVSGWKLKGAISHTFKSGTVIPAGFPLYVSPDVNAFRARSVSPKAGEGRFVQGNYKGQLSARGETVYLVDVKGRTNNATSYPGNPSPAQVGLRITEIMYHPAPAPSGSPYTTEDFEYLELKNIGGGPIALAGIHFTNGIVFDFTGGTLNNGESILLVKNQAAYLSRYGAGATIAGTYLGSLDNAGENIRLDDAVGEKILDFSYNNSWYPITDGLGFSLVIVNENAPFNTWDMKASWRPSGQFNGSPGGTDPAPVVVAPILVNEALTHTDLPQIDTIELYNTNDVDVNVGGWFLTDDFVTPVKYRIPDNTIIPAHGYVIFDEDQFNMDPGVPPSFSLSSKGDEVFLFSGDGTVPTGYYHGFNFGAAQNGVTFGRYVTSLGEEHFVAQSSNTLMSDNALPKVGPVVVSEIIYRPRDLAGGKDNDDDEFIELRNISGSTVYLYDTNAPANTWQLRDAVEFAFAPNTTLAAGAHLLVVGFNPAVDIDTLAAFRSKYDVPVGVSIVGPYSGQLDNSSDDVELYRPDTPELGEVPYILVDRVEYHDDTHWPAQADGTGASLQRIDLNGYGDDPINWFAAAPSAGANVAGGTAPVITGQPQDVNGVLGGSIQMMVTATGTDPLKYQWRYNESPIPGQTTETLDLSNLNLDDGGLYDVVVYNGAGSVISQPGILGVFVPAAILTQPVDLAIREGTSATFTISAVSSSPITYQWRKNGIPIPGATDSSYTIEIVSADDDAFYDVLLTDLVATIASDSVHLTVLINPTVVQAPITQTVPVGGTAIFGIETAGTLPMSYRWRLGSATLRTDTIYSHTSFLVISNVTSANAGAYSVVLTNAAFVSPGVLVRNFSLAVVADTDHDGIPDSVETANGWNPNDPSDFNVDTDGDGSSNGEEYVAGTDWNDPNSYLKVESLSVDGGAYVEFMTVSNRTYSVEYKNSLSDFLWSRLADVVASSNKTTVVVPDLDGSPSRIYRLVTPRKAD